jgi:hypothetical protein
LNGVWWLRASFEGWLVMNASRGNIEQSGFTFKAKIPFSQNVSCPDGTVDFPFALVHISFQT